MLNDFLQFDFLQNALLSGIIIGIVCPIIGVFLVIRRSSLIADTLSHVTFAGVATGLFLQKQFSFFQVISPVSIGTAFSLVGGLVIDRCKKIFRSYEELALPIILAVSIGYSVVLISLADGFNANVYNYLFGSLTAVSDKDLKWIFAIALIVLFIILLLFKELFFLSFDEEAASSSGIRVKFVNIVFTILVALVISISLNIVGILLISSLITLPAACALQLSNSFKQMFLYSILISLVAIFSGLFLSYYFDIATGGTIVLVLSTILLIILLMKQAVKKLISIERMKVIK
ncbi:metal ABC transporter permease [Caldibacillus lycopersici]|uniref:Metal ABC transporter permease n=1 Tax=Perspicuibacillus lycopersici TaxID=1325689 RepID=A0AAE3LQ00_9BACI|nr:metal ABC transporter permease [Perspicuibacillus lycopersici]MCU9612894.1 metal ABC transporter permease [Perspicuibacillus lycopersici]